MNDSKKVDSEKPGSGLVGFAAIATCVIGVGAVIAAIAAFSESEFVGVGVCLIASALSFGLMLNAFLRN